MRRHDVVIVGGGNAGISLGARLLREDWSDVAVVEPSSVHRYRPLLNYVGAGQASMRDLERPMGSVVPAGCTWRRDTVTAVDAAEREVRTAAGDTLGYDTLVLCPGLEEDWDATPGLHEGYTAGWAGSTFVPGSVEDLWGRLRGIRSGTVVFTMPPEPAPCGATALKPLFLTCDHWHRTGALRNIDVHLVLPAAAAVGLERADRRLERLYRSYGVQVHRHGVVSAVDHGARTVTVAGGGGTTMIDDVTFAHVVPRYRAPQWIAASGLAADADPGLVDIDPATLRHRRHDDIWGLGDAAQVRTRPSGGALRHQVEVLAHNLRAARSGDDLTSYDGYTVMPVTTDRRRLMLVEVDRDGRQTPSVPVLDLTKPRRSQWLFDRYALPVVYFRRILRGRT